MYEQNWGLKKKPFENDMAPEFFFGSQTHQAALLKLRYLMENRLGAGMLVGGTGCGKTYLLNLLIRQLSDDYGPIVHLLYPQLSPLELLAYLAVELGAEESRVQTGDGAVRHLERQLRNYCREGRRPVVVIDDAHLIDDPHVFRALHLLLNYRDRPDIEFTLLMTGERSLLGRVSRLAQLDGRLGVKSVVRPLNDDETTRYVAHRLNVAGTDQPIFEATALRALFELSEGVPRQINRLADLALLVGYADAKPRITAEDVEAVSQETLAAVPD